MSDDDELANGPAASRDGSGSNVVPLNGGKPIDEHEEPEQEQLAFEIEDPGSKQNFGTLIPKNGPDGRPMPVKQKVQAKGKTMAANDTRPDVSAPVDRVTEQVIEEVRLSYKRNEDLEIEAVTVTYVYGVRGVWNAKSEAAKVAMGLA